MDVASSENRELVEDGALKERERETEKGEVENEK